MSVPRASLSGAKEMRAKFARLRQRIPDEIGRALYVETQVEATEVKRRTPVDTGELRATVHVVGPIRQGRRVYTLIVVGGLAAPYALYVHEDLDAIHKVGQAKFLESVIYESRPHMAARVARRIELHRGLG